MSEKYKIGDISKLTKIPVQTLRFYEEKQIISPAKDKSSGYRYYDAWVLNDLFDAMVLRESDFSLQQIVDILNTNDLEDMSRVFMDQEAQLLKKIELYRIKLNAVSAHRLRIQNFNHHLNKFTKCMNPDLIFYRYRKNNRFLTKDEFPDLEKLAKEISPWIDAFPSTIATFYIPSYELNSENGSDFFYWWGWSIPAADSGRYNLKPQSPNEYIPSTNCVYTVFCAGEEGTFAPSFYEQVYSKILEAGYLVNSNVFGRLIIKTHEANSYKRYFEVWIPVS